MDDTNTGTQAGDQPQTETGADVNALRNNFQVGESKVLGVKNARKLPEADKWTVTALVEGSDKDTDNVTALNGYEPKEGENALFVRTEDGLTVEAAPAA